MTHVPRRFGSRSALRAAAALPLALCCGEACARQTAVTWATAASGAWGTSAFWNPMVVPNNAGPNTFNVGISATGAPYIVTLDGAFTITDLLLDSADATLDLQGNTLTMAGAYTHANAAVVGAAGSGLSISGAASFADAAVTNVDAITASGDLTFGGANVVLMHVGQVNANGAAHYNSTVATEVCDVEIGHGGSTADWAATAGAIRLGLGARIVNGASTTFTINNAQTLGLVMPGHTGTFENRGTLRKASAGLTDINGVTLTNDAATGVIEAAAGTLRADTVSNYTSATETLTGGTWRVLDGATLDLAAQTVKVNRADVTLSGAGSAFTALTGSLDTNDTAGRLALEMGRSLTTAGDFTNRGVVDVGAGSTLAVNAGSTFHSFNSATKTLTEGVYNLKGAFKFTGADVATLNADVTLDGAGALVNELDQNALLQSATQTNTIGATGKLTTANGVSFVTGGDTNVAAGGALTVGAGTTFRVKAGSSLLNITPTGTFNNAGITVQGTLQADNADVSTVGAGSDVILDGASSQILNGSGQSAFAGLATVDDGIFGIRAGRELTITNPVSPFLLKGAGGKVVVGPRATIDGPGGAQSILTTTGDVRMEDGEIRVDDAIFRIQGAGGLVQTGGAINLLNGGVIEFVHPDATLDAHGTVGGSGMIGADTRFAGDITPGASVGLMHVSGDATLTDTASLVIDFASAASWDRFTVAGDLVFDPAGAGAAAGSLRINTTPGFDAALGSMFEIVSAAAISGSFADYEGMAFAPGRAFVPVYSGNSIFLQVVPAPGALTLLALAPLASRRRRD